MDTPARSRPPANAWYMSPSQIYHFSPLLSSSGRIAAGGSPENEHLNHAPKGVIVSGDHLCDHSAEIHTGGEVGSIDSLGVGSRLIQRIINKHLRLSAQD